jgi:PPOX class probable F420-dependent enzyme
MTAPTAPPRPLTIPESHRDLFTRPVCGVLTTLGPDGAPASSLVWVDERAGTALVNTTLERGKGRNVLRDPRVSLLVVDPENTSRFIQVRGIVELVLDGAEAHADALARRYTRHHRFYGGVYPAEQRALETRVILQIHARRITLDAVHA